jgi:hypothetical protein
MIGCGDLLNIGTVRDNPLIPPIGGHIIAASNENVDHDGWDDAGETYSTTFLERINE